MEEIPPKQAARALWNSLERYRPDVILAGAIAYPSGAIAVRWARKRKKGVIIFDDARLQDVPRSRLVNWVKKRFYSNVDAIFIPAPSHALDYNYWGVVKEQIFYGLNVVDNNFFNSRVKALSEKSDHIRRNYGLFEQFILGVGRQIRKKNWETLLNAYSLMAKKNRSWGLVLIGEGPERPNLEKAVKSQSIRNVYMLPFLSQEKLCEIYSQASCLVLPSFYGETWGLVVNEAMACGLPVLVSRQCGCAGTLVKEGKNGWTFDPDSVEALTDRLIRFVAMPQSERDDMGKYSKKIIANWGLDRFCHSACQAIQFAHNHRRGFTNPMDRIISELWCGRYRPV
jgi:glycosyltransferase involved in cell wall biosynthesis